MKYLGLESILTKLPGILRVGNIPAGATARYTMLVFRSQYVLNYNFVNLALTPEEAKLLILRRTPCPPVAFVTLSKKNTRTTVPMSEY